MKTKIIKSHGWEVIKEYDFLLTLNSGDIVTFNGIEYTVDFCSLDIDENQIEIVIK